MGKNIFNHFATKIGQYMSSVLTQGTHLTLILREAGLRSSMQMEQ